MNKQLKMKKEETLEKHTKSSHISPLTSHHSNGITLIALIITIIVLLILAVVAIQAVKGEGILAHAKNAREAYKNAQENETTTLQDYEAYIIEQSGEQPIAMAEAKNTVLSDTENKKVKDDYGNIVVVPAGFKIVVDETTTYADPANPHVTDGIVIEDESAGNQGSQFVWVPVGKVKTDKNGTTENIIFGRYSWDGSTGTVRQSEKVEGFEKEVTITSGSFNYTELLKNSEIDDEGIFVRAKDIVEFCRSVSINNGYYIGRYEAGDSDTTTESGGRTGTGDKSTPGKLVCKKDQYVYNWILKSDASTKCQEMYTEKPFISDLVNSYAWDTAIIFIQQCGTEPNASTYAEQNMGTKGFLKTGENGDQYRNINDMSGNAAECTTESIVSEPENIRGGYFDGGSSGPTRDTGTRYGALSYKGIDSWTSFRPILYL